LLAVSGYRYWALVWMTVCGSLVNAAGAWLVVRWVPGLASRAAGIGDMLGFGGTVTLNSVVVYVGYNIEKILLGRFWGPGPLGLYGRAYQLVNLPIQQLNSSLYSVAFPALSRIQGDHQRLRRAFVRGYSVLLSLSFLTATTAAVFSTEIIQILLGQKWIDAAPILRRLMPMVVGFALINPFGWLLMATGRVRRSLWIAFLIAPVVVLTVLLAVRLGPTGLASWYSGAVVCLVIPVTAWAIRGTPIQAADCWDAAKRPAAASLLAGLFGVMVRSTMTGFPIIVTLTAGVALMATLYVSLLLYAMGQRHVYFDLFRQLFPQRPQYADVLDVRQ